MKEIEKKEANRKQDKKSEKEKITFGKILNSPISIIVALACLVVGLMIYNRFLIGQVNLYVFSGYTNEFSFLSGTIYTSYDINYFGDSKVVYIGEDKTIFDFEAGYYIKNGENYKTIASAKGLESASDKGVSLKDLIEKSDYSFTEAKKEAEYLSKENIENLDKLVYRIVAKDEKGEAVEIEVPLDIVKVTK